MQSYDQFPPVSLFTSVLRSCPIAALTYASIWHSKSSAYTTRVSRAIIKDAFLMSPTMFSNHLQALARAQVLTFREDKENQQFVIKFIASNEPK